MKSIENVAISVLLPVYNAEKYISEAVDSILNQTFTNFELIILNDGSNDKSIEIVKSKNDVRIRIVENSKNMGLIATLNKGLDLAKGEYIARMDADDISLPERFQKQYDYLEKNKEIGVLGTNFETFGRACTVSNLPLSNEEINIAKYFINPIAHPTVIFRKGIIKESRLKYRSEFLHSEDWGLWMDLSRVTKMANLKEVTLRYRLEGQNITVKNHDSLKKRMFNFYRIYLLELFEKVDDSICEEHWNFVKSKFVVDAPRNWFDLINDYSNALVKIGNEEQLIQQFFKSRYDELFYGISNVSVREAYSFAKQLKMLDVKKKIYLLKKGFRDRF